MPAASTGASPCAYIAVQKPRNERSLLRRLRDALEESRQRAVDREIAVYLSGRGGRLTDRAEREIEQIAPRQRAGDAIAEIRFSGSLRKE